ncbi:MAG: urease accessory protein UreE [Rhizobiaceae bacterium]|nr:urease accessory protein UreE [Rhizobiaceae bacterium]
MKLSLNTDFTKFPRAVSVAPAGDAAGKIAGRAVLAHDERHLRRRAIELDDGGKVLVDLPEPVTLADGDRLVLEDGREIEIGAAPEELYDIRARDAVHLAELAWHIGNRHLAAAISADRILILRDHVIKAMLEGLGATVSDVVEPFSPVRGAYSGHSHGHGHHHDHDHNDHDHDHHHHDSHGDGERDAYGRLPGDPHYGHNHA